MTTIGDLLDRAKALESDGLDDMALAHYKHIYHASPASDTAKLYASALVRMGGRDWPFINRAIKAYPTAELLKASKSEMCLSDGDYETGFKLSKHRWCASKIPSLIQSIPCREYDGSPHDGPLLVIGEQGLGEEILYSSLLGKVPKAVVSADQRLHPLLARSFPQHVFVHRTALRHYSHDGARVVEAMQLAGLLGANGNNSGWLVPNHAKVKAIRDALLVAAKGAPIIGLSWFSANKGLATDKSIPADCLDPLMKSGAFVVNLQYGDISHDADYWHNAGCAINEVMGLDVTNDLDSLAALIMACDAVVTSSNTTAHLSGALGQRTHLILNARRTVLWFWGSSGDRTPWYPSIQITRAVDGWGKAVADVLTSIPCVK